jgi:uncharacterized protein YjiS (DUF1127 family)
MTAAHISEWTRWRAHDGRNDGRGLTARLKQLKDLLALWRRRAYERETLAGLSDQMLRDIGITRCDAINEASKPFWRA